MYIMTCINIQDLTGQQLYTFRSVSLCFLYFQALLSGAYRCSILFCSKGRVFFIIMECPFNVLLFLSKRLLCLKVAHNTNFILGACMGN